MASAARSFAYYSTFENLATLAGLTGTATSVGLTALSGEGDDNPFAHFVPDGPGEALLGAVSPGALAFSSAVTLGAQRDRAAAAQAERDEWLR